MSADVTILLQLAGCFIGLFTLAEVLYHFAHVQAEYTRKLVHVGTGILTLLFPIYLHEVWQVVAICSSFLILLLLSLKFNLLKSINKIERKSAGSLLYPVIVILVYIFYHHHAHTPFHAYLYFYLPVLVMAICDPVAALVGTQYSKRHNLTGKTWAGSAGFFMAAAVVCFCLFSIFNTVGVGIGIIILHSLAIAVLTMLAEKWSTGGWDNFTIPLVVVVYLHLIQNIA